MWERRIASVDPASLLALNPTSVPPVFLDELVVTNVEDVLLDGGEL